MTIFHVFEYYESFNNGTFETLLGTYSTLDKAKEVAAGLAKNSAYEFKQTGPLNWSCVGHDEDSQYIEVKPATIDEENL